MKLKKNLNNLRVNLFVYFLIFTIVLVFIIWILQTVFFETNYKNSLSKTMDTYAEIITESVVQNGTVNESAVTTLKEAGVETLILTKPKVDSIDVLYPSRQHVTSKDSNFNVYTTIINNLIKEDASSLNGASLNETIPSIYNVRKVVFNGEDCYLALICNMSTLASTVNVLRLQLILTTIIVLVISVFFSWLIAGRLSAPIDKMSSVAEKWAHGDESVTFTEGGYSEIDQLAKTLNYAKTEKAKSQTLQRDLLANISHDLKTPLTMIKAYAEMIQDISGNDTKKRLKHTGIIINEADRLTTLVNDILNLSHIQATVSPIEKKPFNLSEAIENVIMRFTTVLEKDEYNITTNVLPNVFVNANEEKIEEVIYNLFSNAVNYTGDDKVIKVYLTVKDGKATLEIMDTGRGIQSDKIDTIWEKYYRSSETHHRQVKGSGLGLSIVKAILTNQNTDFGVISKENVGSNFYIVFDALSEETVKTLKE
ncbi:MAG: HAMP domain-containing histidine kinase [Clostridia bacterium]|nr:HAMP domain-containing histidine kinase [Clostridia bacterium]